LQQRHDGGQITELLRVNAGNVFFAGGFSGFSLIAGFEMFIEFSIQGGNMSVLREAFIDELKDLLDAERQLLQALPKMAKAAENDQLRVAFEEHEEQTRRQVSRLGQVFEAFEEEATGKKCKGMAGLIKEAEELIEKEEGDAALIAAAQKAEHYEIAAYGTLAAWAVALGQESAAQTLTETLEEEKETDKKLTAIAQTVVNSIESQRDEEQSEESSRGASRASNRRREPASARQRSQKAAPRSKRQSSRGSRSRTSRAPQSKRARATSRK
jgi:ferritin-like metal-binding protein YciE